MTKYYFVLLQTTGASMALGKGFAHGDSPWAGDARMFRSLRTARVAAKKALQRIAQYSRARTVIHAGPKTIVFTASVGKLIYQTAGYEPPEPIWH